MINLTISERCVHCNGSGSIKHAQGCDTCYGTGKKEIVIGFGNAGDNEDNKCPECKGEGKKSFVKVCPLCKGTRKMHTELHEGENQRGRGRHKNQRQRKQKTNARKVKKLDAAVVYDFGDIVSHTSLKVGTVVKGVITEIRENLGIFVTVSRVRVLIYRDFVPDLKKYNLEVGKEVFIEITVNSMKRINGILCEVAKPEIRAVVDKTRGSFKKINQIDDSLIGEEVACTALVISVDQKYSYSFLRLRDETQDVTGVKKSNINIPNFNSVQVGDIVNIHGVVQQYKDVIQIQLTNVSIASGTEVEQFNSRMKIDAKEGNWRNISDLTNIVNKEIEVLLDDSEVALHAQELQDIAIRLIETLRSGGRVRIMYRSTTSGVLTGLILLDLCERIYERVFGSTREKWRQVSTRINFYGENLSIETVARQIEDLSYIGTTTDTKNYLILVDIGHTNEDLQALALAELYNLGLIYLGSSKLEEKIKDYFDLSVSIDVETNEMRLVQSSIHLLRMVFPSVTDSVRHLSILDVAEKEESKTREEYEKLLSEIKFSRMDIEQMYNMLAYFLEEMMQFTYGNNRLKMLEEIIAYPKEETIVSSEKRESFLEILRNNDEKRTKKIIERIDIREIEGYTIGKINMSNLGKYRVDTFKFKIEKIVKILSKKYEKMILFAFGTDLLVARFWGTNINGESINRAFGEVEVKEEERTATISDYNVASEEDIIQNIVSSLN